MRSRGAGRAFRFKPAAFAAIPLALLFASAPAFAGEGDADAERLFREGQNLLEQRKFGEACPKFEQAYSKDRALGTLINLAFCHKEQGATWYAWLEFREAEVKATELNRPDRKDFARKALVELEKQLPKVIIDNPQKIPLTDVIVEDRKVWEAERGAVFAAEAGQRKFVFKAKGKKQTSTLINVVRGEKAQHVPVPDMEDGTDEVPVAPPPPKAEEPKPDPGANKDEHPGSTQRTVGWVGVGVGGVALVVGIIFGINTFASPCAGGKTCPQDKQDAAHSSGAIATVGFIVGGVGIVGGGALVLTAPTSSSSAPSGAHGVAPARAAKVTVMPRIGAGWAGLTGTF